MIIKKDGRREAFDRNKVASGIIKACEKRPVSMDQIDKITGDIERGLNNLMEKEVRSDFIGELVMDELKKKTLARAKFNYCMDIMKGKETIWK